mgnify:CR=1 FL=1
MPKSQASSSRRRALLVLGLLGVFGFGGGAIANQVVKKFLALPEDAEPLVYEDAPVAEGPGEKPGPGVPPESGDPERPRPTRALTEKQYADIILRRNIFDSSAVYDPNAVKPGDPSGECKSDGNVRLLATIVADNPTYSSALISIGSGRDGRADGYAFGDEISGEGRITLIEQKKICLDGGSCICIGGDKPKGAAAATGKGDAPSGEGVTKKDDTHFEVDRSVIADGIANFDQLATQMRVVPHKGSDGQVDGFRLSAIRRGSLFDKLGIKNGDIVHGVNGNPLTSTEAAMGVYQQLQNESSFTFEITRRNQRQTMEYSVR